jgi:glutamate racemase
MILWFFDSWLGWEVVMDAFQKEFPEIDMILEMDRKNAPYGEKTDAEIRALTKAWVERLYARWATVVILACNTASVHALRWLQHTIFPDRSILGVTVPWAEAVAEWNYRKVWVLATEATVRSHVYRDRIATLDGDVIVEEIAATGLVPLIEQGITSWPEIEALLREYLSQFSPDIEALVLGCTHYPMVREAILQLISQCLSNPIQIIDPGLESAKKMKMWFVAHPHILGQ